MFFRSGCSIDQSWRVNDSALFVEIFLWSSPSNNPTSIKPCCISSLPSAKNNIDLQVCFYLLCRSGLQNFTLRFKMISHCGLSNYTKHFWPCSGFSWCYLGVRQTWESICKCTAVIDFVMGTGDLMAILLPWRPQHPLWFWLRSEWVPIIKDVHLFTFLFFCSSQALFLGALQ